MKVAICLSGLSRDFRTVAPYTYENLAKPLDADVFIHTWDESTHKTAVAFRDSDFDVHTDLHAYLQDIFNPDKLFFDQENQSDGEWISVPTHHHSPEIGPMFYSIYRANQLKRAYEEYNKGKYDIVIRARMDHYFHKPYSFDEEISAILSDKKKIFVAFNGTHRNTADLPNGFPEGWNDFPAPSGIYDTSMRKEWRYPQPGVEDQFAIGTSESMDIYSSVYPNLGNWDREGGEILLGRAVFGSGLKPNWSNIRFKGLVKFDDNHSWYRSYYDEDYEKLEIVKFKRVK